MPERGCPGIARVLGLLGQAQCIPVCIPPVAKHQFVRLTADFDVVHCCRYWAIFWRHGEGLVVADCSRWLPAAAIEEGRNLFGQGRVGRPYR